MDRRLSVMEDRDAIIQEILPLVGGELGKHLPNIGDASLFNLVTAIVATKTPGIAGELVISIPRKVTNRLELHWHSAAPQA